MRFSIRDLLWATVVVAMGLGWWLSYRSMDAERSGALRQAHRQRATLERARLAHDRLVNEVSWSSLQLSGHMFYVNWTILDEPIAEP